MYLEISFPYGKNIIERKDGNDTQPEFPEF